jgi:hypothetical protein
VETCRDALLEIGEPITQGRVCNAKKKDGDEAKGGEGKREAHAEDGWERTCVGRGSEEVKKPGGAGPGPCTCNA